MSGYILTYVCTHVHTDSINLAGDVEFSSVSFGQTEVPRLL